jgi:hypothetical protein
LYQPLAALALLTLDDARHRLGSAGARLDTLAMSRAYVVARRSAPAGHAFD